jgi:hypothetical protein
MRVAIEPIRCFSWEGDPEPMHLALEFLNSIQITGTINEAAALSNLSPRNALNLLDEWSIFLAHRWSSLRVGLRSCSPLWARCSCGPASDCRRDLAQLQNFAQKLEEEIRQLVPRRQPILRINASQDSVWRS